MKDHQITEIIGFLGRTEGMCKGISAASDECSQRLRDKLKAHARAAKSLCDDIIRDTTKSHE